MSDNEHITDFISAAVADKPVAATKAFTQALEPKLDAALHQKRDEVSRQVFNTTETGEEPNV